VTRWSSLLGGLGLVFTAFGLVSVLLLVLGMGIELPWIGLNFGLGLALLVAAGVMGIDAIRERLASGEGRRIGKYGLSAIAQVVLSLLIVACLAFLSARYHWRYDASEAGVHSLSDQTQKVLAGLDRDVEVIAFYPKLEQVSARDLLDRYVYASDRFHVQYADPNQHPDLVERYKINSDKLADGVLRVAIGDESVEVDEASEDRLTNALVQLTRNSHKKAYFLTGHNERPVDGKGADAKDGMKLAAEALRNENYRFEPLLLATKGDVPEDADVVIVAGPTRPLLPEEHRALERYLERGGAMLVTVDPRAHTDLVDDLARWGVDAGDDVIVDRVQGLFGQAMSPLAGEYANHEITRDMREVTLFPMARSVTPRKDTDGRFTEIVRTSPNSWAERNLDLLFGEGRAELGADDLAGPVSIAVAGRPAVDGAGAAAPKKKEEGQAKGSKPEPRLVVFGDTDFASNQYLGAYRNRDLFVNSVNWLLGDVDAISIRPALSRASRVTLSIEQLSDIRYLSLFVLPEAIAVAGVFAWWSRRRAPGR
jgi:gliding motility-associatede transport system auxiliary component